MRPLLSLILFALVPLGAQAGSLKHDVISPNVRVETARSRGAGTALKVGDETLVLTAAHVVQEESAFSILPFFNAPAGPASRVSVVQVEDDVEVKQPAQVVFYSPPTAEGGLDLALLRPLKPNRLPVAATLEEDPKLEEGEDAWYIGFGGGLDNHLQKTIVNRVDYLDRRFPDFHRFTVLNGGGWYGHSGGGLYVKRGCGYRLVGVVVLLQNTSNPKSPVQAVTPADIARFLLTYRLQEGPLVVPSPSPSSPEMPRSTP